MNKYLYQLTSLLAGVAVGALCWYLPDNYALGVAWQILICVIGVLIAVILFRYWLLTYNIGLTVSIISIYIFLFNNFELIYMQVLGSCILVILISFVLSYLCKYLIANHLSKAN